MFTIKQLEPSGSNSAGPQQTTIIGLYDTKDEAESAIKNLIKNFKPHGYDDKHDYWWGRKDDKLYHYVIAQAEE